MSLEPGSRLTIMSTAREMSPGLDAFPKEQNSRNPLSQRILGSLNLSPGYDQIYKQNGLLGTLVVHRTQSKNTHCNNTVPSHKARGRYLN